jgi:SOS-response transcriptional repressor LexA
MSEPYERLQQARIAAGYQTASAAAEAIGIRVPTYIHHENGTNGLSRVGVRYAKFFHVSLEWLLEGKGPMRPSRATIPLAGYVGAGATVYPINDDQTGHGLDVLDYFPDATEICALEVRGDSQYPRYLAGEIILIDREPRAPRDLIGRYCLVDLDDGRRLVKLLRRGTENGLFRLESHNAPPEDDVKVMAAYKVRGTLDT